ncbi:hypothetical protein JZ751_002241 [Albula glossodonta]|uniref:C2 domain-containing protein n=1 Tax=Albula glossodonta TaxID=121402 RepID=A0A8T2P7H9_9TELE|nr:hypothetical protein JZ751_002241 [Albula glossodonta]
MLIKSTFFGGQRCSGGMKNKKPRSAKVGKRIKNVPSDISPSTSLPPLVEGQVRCFLRVTIGRVLWTIPKPPVAPLVRLRWWGETSSGTHFCPRDGSPVGQRGVKSTARYAIRCGPKQFTSYLTDMGVLVLDVLTKPDHLPFGRVQVTGIACLSLSHSISGFFTLLSPTSERLGELQVSLHLEPLTETYDSFSSLHTADASVGTAVSKHGPRSQSAPSRDVMVVPSLFRPLSANSGRESVAGSSANTPRGKDHLYFQERTNGYEGPGSVPQRNVIFSENGQPSSRSQFEEEGLIPARIQCSTSSTCRPEAHVSAERQTSKDILSVLLDRGSKLRNAMVVSALKSTLDSDLAVKDIPHPVSKDNIVSSSSLLPLSSSGRLLENLLHSGPSVPLTQRDVPLPKHPDLECFADTENRAVDLLLGSVDGSILWDVDSSPPEFLSGTSSVLGDSELIDPLYDQSLLENLFYRATKSGSSLSDLTAEEDDSLSIKKKKKKRKWRVSDGKEEIVVLDNSSQIPEDVSTIPDLSMDRITELGRIHMARVNIHSLTILVDSTSATPHKTTSKGKPPRPHLPRKCSYFVEYFFPVVSSKHDVNHADMATEVIRVASCKVAGGVVKFQQRSVFPVHFGETVIKHWWNTDLTFKIYSRERTQKKPVAIGRAVFPLRSLLKSERLGQSTVLPILALEEDREEQKLGTLKVSFELGQVSKDVSTTKGMDESSKGLPNALLTPPRKVMLVEDNAIALPQSLDTDTAETATGPKRGSGKEEGTPMSGVWVVQDFQMVQGPTPSHTPDPLHTSNWKQQQPEEVGGVLLHALLAVPDGKDFNNSPMPPNIYLNCKFFGSDETTRSVVSWGKTHPTFNFIQVAPIVLSTRLLERMRNNMMVIEVWQKGGSMQDRLMGLVKMPLQQFYMSFRDPKISQLLLQVQYPVVALDGYMPVVDVFTGRTQGSLRVLLAMGLAEQIISLQQMRDEDLGLVPHPPRPAHSLDKRQLSDQKENLSENVVTIAHVFEVTVEKVKGLTPLQSTVWGEADCYVQYSFPNQAVDNTGDLDSHTIESSVSLRQFRTGTTLCVPDPVFGHSESHTLVTPAEVPVQRLLLSSCSSQGPSARGGVQFEVWCRYYYPNVRDQLVAKALLPLSKLCAMVTMQTHEHTGPQVFSLPLLPRAESPACHHPQPSGLLDVCVRYKPQPTRAHGLQDKVVASQVIALAVQVHRAAGLQAAAWAAARHDEALRYYADVGVNTYVTMHLSFLPEQERRSTRMVARSFCPDFQHHTEYPCNLMVQSAGGETRSLAELLEGATAIFTVHHRDSRKGKDSPTSKDTVLGTVRIQLAELIHKRTGISGWFPVSLPHETGSRANPSSAGGLEVSVTFAHHLDRERVIKAARGIGWDLGEEEEDVEENEKEERDSRVMLSLSVSMPKVWLPLHCLLLPGHRALERSTYCYLRYKLYEEPAFCSTLCHPSIEEDPEGANRGLASVVFMGSRVVELKNTLPLRWYLREEKLEVQVWVAFGKERRPRPHDTDRLVGSAYVDLSSLSRRAAHKLTISGVYPLFRRSAPDLEGAALRVHITMTPPHLNMPLPEQSALSGNSEGECDRQGAFYSGEGEEEVEEEVPMPLATAAEDTFSVNVTVDRAMHLSLKGTPQAERSSGLPSCCVSYATADAESPITTPVVEDSECPVWDHQWMGRLAKEILVDPHQTMVFKVWHKGDVERVIGFASVDLSPLLSGFQSVCGWYNITDFHGQCQGQLKVSISPMKGVQNLRRQRQAAQEDATKDSAPLFQALPLCYHTTGMYSSFPTHISRYTEQRINTSPDQVEALLSGRSSLNGRHEEHIHNVRMFHQSLHEGERALHGSAPTDPPPSRATLFSALRKNLSELDDIQRYFSRKLSTPTFPGLSEQACPSRLGGHRDSESDTDQLLLRSHQLVGKVNNLICDLHGQSLSAVPKNTQGISNLAAPTQDHILSAENCFLPAELSESKRGSVPQPSEEAKSSLDGELPIASPNPQVMDTPGNTCMNVKEIHSEEDDISHDEHEEEGVHEGENQDEEVEEEEEEQEYEETVIEPRALNEITSVTDRTSPWTSLLSEPDLGSLESLEGPEEQSCQTEEVENRRGRPEEEDTPCDRSSEELVSTTPEGLHTDHKLSEGSDADDADTVRGVPVICQAQEIDSSAAAELDLSPGSEETAKRGPCNKDIDSKNEGQTASYTSEHLWKGGDTDRSEKEESMWYP